MIFDKFPKKRTKLPADYQKIYNEHYKKNRDGVTTASFLSKRMEAWMHKKVAADLQGRNDKSTLELGAGTLNQLEYENTHPYDIVEPFKELLEYSPYKNRVNQIYNDISEIDNNKQYDRIVSIATFEHITDLPKVLAKSCLLLSKNGNLRVSIPNEGTFLWKLAYTLTTGIEFKFKYKLDYEVLMKHEHVNTAEEIENVIRYFYRDIQISYFGLNKKLAFYRFYNCGQPDVDRAKSYLDMTK